MLPALFVGHGNPMNALDDNVYSRAWAALGRTLPRPRAILCISAHWYVPGTAITAMEHPKTIHDFGGFPRELYAVRYLAPGDPQLAARIAGVLAPIPVRLDDGSWGLDHGSWSILVHMYPDAEVPVLQLSIDETQPPAFHYELGRALARLRDEDVLILGSGNVVHNLETYAWRRRPAGHYAWADRFERRVRELLTADDPLPLVEYERMGEDARLSVPTPEHYLPLLYVLGTRAPGESVVFPVEGVDGGSVSMLAVQLGR
ncbi:MAG TPA: 4,5-DOPA dioxygenase extradiol [Candidatus Acidoferrales bacterium]|nr:4,5-DOPA dioxygenase extradiol [Candidatus Acidoferrales bacterium]